MPAGKSSMQRATVWKGTKLLAPYGNLKESDYNKYLTSGKANVQLGKALEDLTVTALATVIANLHPYAGILVSLTDIAAAVYDVLVAVNPKTEYLGCIYSTYTHGAYDYKYVNQFYTNKECTGGYDTKISYEHFVVY